MSERAPPAPCEWMEGWPHPWPDTRQQPDGALIRACFCIVALQLARTRNDQHYLRLTLSDRYGPLEARLWEGAETAASTLRTGAYVGVQGKIEHYHDELQLCLEQIEPLHVGLGDLDLFLPRSPRSATEMERELEQLVASLQDAPLRQLVAECLGPGTAIGPGFRLAPAAKFNHHAYLGGLLEHTLSVAQLCDRLAQHYASAVDRDLLVAAALLHDVGKVREIGATAGFPYTDEGKLLGHILLGLEMVTAAARGVPGLAEARLLLLQHLIAAHQGRYEWQSPREPATIEAIVLHYADDLDAKLQQVRELMTRGEGPWTSWDRSFRREFLRHLRPTDVAGTRQDGEAETSPPEVTAPEVNAPPTHTQPVEPPGPPATSGPDPASEVPGPMRAGRDRGAERGRASGRKHGPNGFDRFSEDTLDLFGGG